MLEFLKSFFPPSKRMQECVLGYHDFRNAKCDVCGMVEK